MHYCSIDYYMILSNYLKQLQDIAYDNDVRLIDMFTQANVPTSTYYRAINGMELRFSTAQKVANAIRSDISIPISTSSG
jgi:predicted transcriptional regulator